MTRRQLLSAIPVCAAFSVARAAESTGRLRAGAATSNITPPLGISLDGPISQNGPAKHVHDELHARAFVLGDGATKIAIVICDSTMIHRDLFDEAKAIATSATGIPAGNMLMAATHTHSTPRLGVRNGELERWYRDFLPRRIADAVTRANNNLAPAKIGWGSTSVPDYVFNRRWFVKPEAIPPNPFGKKGDRVQMNPPAGSPDLLEPAGPVDPELYVLSLQHEDGRPLALLANYGLHYVGGSRRGELSADYFGLFSARVRELAGEGDPGLPFVAAMSNGTSGDVNAIDFEKERVRSEPYERMRAIAHDLAYRAMKIAEGVEYRSELKLAAATSELELGIRKPDAERRRWARMMWAEAQGAERLTRPQVYARETLLLEKFPDRLSIPMQAFKIGELGVSGIPNEVFAETGLAIKQLSPFKSTFTIELANGYHGYLPTAAQHGWGGYETWAATSSQLEVDAETKIRAEALRLLREVSR